MTDEQVANIVIGAAIKVHKQPGPGLLESAYQECLYHELMKIPLQIEKQKPMPLIYEDVKLEIGYRVDLMVENKLVIELKSVEALTDVHLAQTLTYLKLSGFRLGLLINFNVSLLKHGIKKVIHSQT